LRVSKKNASKSLEKGGGRGCDKVVLMKRAGIKLLRQAPKKKKTALASSNLEIPKKEIVTIVNLPRFLYANRIKGTKHWIMRFSGKDGVNGRAGEGVAGEKKRER